MHVRPLTPTIGAEISGVNLGEAGHVGHRTTGAHVRQYRRLLGPRQNIGDFGHEMHAAENNVIGIRLRRQLGQPQRVARQVGVFVDVGALIMMAEDDRALTERSLGRNDAALARVIVQRFETVKCNCSGWHPSTPAIKGLKHYHNMTKIPL